MKISRLITVLVVLQFLMASAYAQTQKICRRSDTPAGWVVVDVDIRCPGCCGVQAGAMGTMFTIRKIDALPVNSTVSVCIVDNLPAGWVVIATDTRCPGCCGVDAGAMGTRYTIKRIQ